MGESGNLTRVEERGIYHLNSHLPALKDTLRAIPAWLSDTNIRAGARMFETFPKARRHPAISFQAECPHVKTAARKLCQGHVAILGSKSHTSIKHSTSACLDGSTASSLTHFGGFATIGCSMGGPCKLQVVFLKQHGCNCIKAARFGHIMTD